MPTVTLNRMTALDAAEKVLQEAGAPMRAREMLERMAEKGYWSSPNGQRPLNTLRAAICIEMKNKGEASRFSKVDRGLFAVNDHRAKQAATSAA